MNSANLRDTSSHSSSHCCSSVHTYCRWKSGTSNRIFFSKMVQQRYGICFHEEIPPEYDAISETIESIVKPPNSR